MPIVPTRDSNDWTVTNNGTAFSMKLDGLFATIRAFFFHRIKANSLEDKNPYAHTASHNVRKYQSTKSLFRLFVRFSYCYWHDVDHHHTLSLCRCSYPTHTHWQLLERDHMLLPTATTTQFESLTLAGVKCVMHTGGWGRSLNGVGVSYVMLASRVFIYFYYMENVVCYLWHWQWMWARARS